MTGLHLGLVLSLAMGLVQQQAAPPSAPDASTWPIPGVLAPGTAGVTAPRVINEVKAQYTGAAMRARIQGVAVLECVVEADGRVGPVRIVRSLDAVHGLDEEAIRTVRKWRFVPAMKDGVPVRVVVKVEISFAIRDRSDSTPILGWPDSFTDASEVISALPAGWSEDSVATSTLEVRVAHPPGWSIRKETNGTALAMLLADDARGHRAMTIGRPDPSRLDLVTPLPEARLREFLDGVGQTQAAQTLDVRMVRSGQVQSSGRLWVWLEMAAPTANLPGAPELAAHMRAAHDGIRMWILTTTAGGQMIQVSCSVLHAANSSEADKQEEIRRAGLEFGAMLKRMSVVAR